jgi:hypothetical protein
MAERKRKPEKKESKEKITEKPKIETTKKPEKKEIVKEKPKENKK